MVGDTVVVGSALQLGIAPTSKENVPGYVRGYDVHTGKLLWTFHTIAQPGEFGNETWENGSWKYTGNTAVWAPMSADPELGYVYLPVETPTGDFYGGHRPGDDLFDESLVCVDARTGKRVWHYQIIHHGIWDWDNPAAPVLLDITVNGKKIKAVAQVTKQAFVYVFDRVTGEPVWPIEERPVPPVRCSRRKDLAHAAVPHQARGLRPAGSDARRFDRLHAGAEGRSAEDRVGVQDRAALHARHRSSMPTARRERSCCRTPPAARIGRAPRPILRPAFSTCRRSRIPMWRRWCTIAKHSDMDYIGKTVILEKINKGVPIVKPPYGRITAYDLNSGDQLWMIPNGQPPDDIKNNPALKGVDTSKFGNPERALLLATKTLLFSADATGLTPVNGSYASTFRALDKKTGETIFELKLPTHATGVPMTYLAKGKQYIVVAVGGRGEPAELVALAEPSPNREKAASVRGMKRGAAILSARRPVFPLLLWTHAHRPRRTRRAALCGYRPGDGRHRRLDHAASVGPAVVRKARAAVLDDRGGFQSRARSRAGAQASGGARERCVPDLFFRRAAARIWRSRGLVFGGDSGDLGGMAGL